MSHEPKRTVRQAITRGAASPRPQPISSCPALEREFEESAKLGAIVAPSARGDTPASAASAQRPQIFNFDAQGVRVVGSWDKPQFVAKDVCDVLEIQNHRDTLAKVLEADEKGVDTIYTLGGPQEMLTVNESGLYALIFRSRKPQARLFRRWVTGTVLPAIRKTGVYQPAAPLAVLPDAPLAVRSREHRAELAAKLPWPLPGPDQFPPKRWAVLYWQLLLRCEYRAGCHIASVDLADRLRLECPQFSHRQILRVLPWMVIHRFGISRSNDIRIAGRLHRGYRSLCWVQPLALPVNGGAS